MTEVPRILSCIALAAVASGAPTASAFEVDAALSGGNVRVLGVTNETVRVAPDIRDTTRWWFWWRFRVTGAAGRTLGFEFPGNECGPVGSRGPVVSTDRGLTWHYAPRVSSHAFTYTFAADENETWFAQTIPYDEVHWRRFLDRHAAWRGRAFEEGVLCTTVRGYRAEKARFGCLTGHPRFRVCLTARHHAAEATGSYVLEGVLDRVLADDDVGAWLRANVEFLVVPFMDKDGVVDGDQGKCRKPHDHNRDYLLRRHPTVAATEDWILAQPGRKLDVFLDLHSPWIDGIEDERFYAWYSRENWNALEERRFGRMLERNQRGAMRYRIQDDPREFSVRRAAEYTEGRLLASELWALRALDSLRLGIIFETPFAVANGATVAEDAWREIGGDIAQTLKEFLLSPTPAYPSCDGVYPHLAVFNGSPDCRLRLTALDDGALEAQTCDREGRATPCDWRYRIDPDLRQRILLPDAPRPAAIPRPSVDVGFDNRGEFVRTPDGAVRLPRIAGRPCGEIAVGKETAVIGGVVWRIPEWHPVRATPETVTSVSTLGGRPVWGIAGGPSAAPLKATANVLVPDKDAVAERPFAAEATVWKNEAVAAGALSDPIAVDGFDSYEACATAPVECVKEGGRVRLRAMSASTNLTASLVCTKRGAARPLDARLQKLPSLGDDKVKKGIGLLHCDPRRPDFIWYHSPTDGDFELEPDLKLHPARSYAYGDAKKGEGDYVRTRILEDAPKASDITHVDPSQVLGRFRRPFRPGRDLVNFGGVLYELPTEGGDDWNHLKPLVRHGRAITDFITWNGLLVLVGAEANSLTVVSADALGTDYGGACVRNPIWRMVEDKLGLFIHWGVYSVPARGEWMMQRENVPSAEYAKYADAFRPPESFSPREWVRLAKRAGARYAVLTTRHHDGFALFDTKTTDFNSVRTTGRDFVREFCEACRAEGIRVGLYFSLMNWQYWRTGGAYEPAAWAEQVRTTREALRELMTNYGKVDYLWYDGCQAPGGNDAVRIQELWDTRGLNEMVRRLQPDILVNDRSARPEDYATPEQTIDPPPRGRMWESCLTCNRNWGYCAADTDWKSSESLFRSLLHCCRFGGNLLVNVGPCPDGSVPETCVKALEGLGDRIAACPEAIYGTERDDFTEAVHEAGVVTKSGGAYWLWALKSDRLDGAEKLEQRGPGVYRVHWKPGARPCRWLGGRHDVELKPGEAPTLCDDTGLLQPPNGPVEERNEPTATSAAFTLPAGGRWRLEVGYVTADGFKDTLEETYLASAPGERHVIGLPPDAKGVYAVRQTPVWTCRRPTEWQIAGVFRTEAREKRYSVDYIKEIFATHDFVAEAKRATFMPVGAENLKADHGDILVSHTWSAPAKEIGYAFGRLVLTSDRDETVMAAAGADWQWKVLVNGETAVDLTMGPKPRMFPLKLRKGANEILVVTHCGSGQHFFSFSDNRERAGDPLVR